MHHMAISLVSTGITGLGMTAGSALVVGIGALRLSQGAITVPQLFAILFLSYECLRPLDPLLAYWHRALMGLASAQGVFGMLDTRPEVAGGALADAPIVPELAFEDVVFGYAQGERPALHGLSFRVAPGDTVALVGRSGAGKVQPWSRCCCATSIHRRATSGWAGATCATTPGAAARDVRRGLTGHLSVPWHGRREPAPWRGQQRARPSWRMPRVPPTPTSLSPRCRRATRRSLASAGSSSQAASASASPSRGRC